jgi:hypothetical protein
MFYCAIRSNDHIPILIQISRIVPLNLVPTPFFQLQLSYHRYPHQERLIFLPQKPLIYLYFEQNL